MAGKRILIIDDDADFTEATRTVLEAKGYLVSCAEDKKKGREMVERGAPDLIIMDVIMDKMSDGFDLSREVKCDKRHCKIPILIMTAVGRRTGFKFAPRAGDDAWLPVEDFVEKPVKPEVLLRKVEELLSKKDGCGTEPKGEG